MCVGVCVCVCVCVCMYVCVCARMYLCVCTSSRLIERRLTLMRALMISTSPPSAIVSTRGCPSTYAHTHTHTHTHKYGYTCVYICTFTLCNIQSTSTYICHVHVYEDTKRFRTRMPFDLDGKLQIVLRSRHQMCTSYITSHHHIIISHHHDVHPRNVSGRNNTSLIYDIRTSI